MSHLKSYLCFLVLIFFSTFGIAQNKDAILGNWLSSGGDGKILIYKKGDSYFGKLVWLSSPDNESGNPRIDHHNPDPSLQNRPLLGIVLLKDFKYASYGVWGNGKIYDPKSGKTYSSKMSMTSSDKLEIRGYVGISLLGRTESWSRVK